MLWPDSRATAPNRNVFVRRRRRVQRHPVRSALLCVAIDKVQETPCGSAKLRSVEPDARRSDHARRASAASACPGHRAAAPADHGTGASRTYADSRAATHGGARQRKWWGCHICLKQINIHLQEWYNVGPAYHEYNAAVREHCIWSPTRARLVRYGYQLWSCHGIYMVG